MPLAAIFGCAGPRLAAAERDFFRAADPLGFILFARNIEAPDQVRRLTAALRDAVGRGNAPILIDQEGGRVARLRPPHWREAPPAARFGALAARDPELAAEAARLNALLQAAELTALGITVDCAPVLDLRFPGAHEIIGDRAFGSDPDLVARLGRAAAEGLLAGGVTPVIKHIPGHGRAQADSHLELPRVDAPLEELDRTDFVPFRALRDMPWAMTAHVVFTAIDPAQPATTSPAVIASVIRDRIGFDGLLLADDLSMQALSGTPAERARAVLAAGCDIVLHCNGDRGEMAEVADAVAPLTAAAATRLARGRERLGSPPAAVASLAGRLGAILSAA